MVVTGTADRGVVARRRAEPISLERLFLTTDGALKAIYSDNVVLAIDASGRTFSAVDPAGGSSGGTRVLTQLTDCCLSHWAPRLTEILEFRNQVRASMRELAQQGNLDLRVRSNVNTPTHTLSTPSSAACGCAGYVPPAAARAVYLRAHL